MKATQKFGGGIAAALIFVVITSGQAGSGTTFGVPGSNLSAGSNGFDAKGLVVPGKYHTAVDYHKASSSGSSAILASNDGDVVEIVKNGSNDHGLGNAVIIRHKLLSPSNQTIYSLYAHLSSISSGLAKGQIVVKGQVIGMIGSSGYGKADHWGPSPHLHFEFKTSNTLQNPTGSGSYWGYTPSSALDYGYLNPSKILGNSSWTMPPAEIQLTDSGSRKIEKGDLSPSTSDGTSFGSMTVNTSKTATFTIRNYGDGNLVITSVKLAGSSSFSITAGFVANTTFAKPVVLKPGLIWTFVVSFKPSSKTTHTADITINSNDSDESAYNFRVQGIGK